MEFEQHDEEEVVEATTDNMVTSNHLTLNTGNTGLQNIQVLSVAVVNTLYHTHTPLRIFPDKFLRNFNI